MEPCTRSHRPGHAARREQPRRIDELGRIAISAAQAQLAAIGAIRRVGGTHTDVTVQRDTERALQEADRQKDTFLATLAHELRNPLAPIANAVRLLERGDGPTDPRPFAIQIIRRQTAHMARLVDDLLEVSRVTQGRIELRRENILLGTAVLSAAEAVRPLVRERRQTLAVEVAPDLDLVADPARLAGIRRDLPVLIASGDADPLAGGGALIELLGQRYRDAGLADVTVKLYPGGRHEILNETNRDEVTADIVAWLRAHAG